MMRSMQRHRLLPANLALPDRMDVMAKKEPFTTLKDHEEIFEKCPPCRLINPAKSEMGLVSKWILDSINGRLKQKLDVTPRKNSAVVIE